MVLQKEMKSEKFTNNDNDIGQIVIRKAHMILRIRRVTNILYLIIIIIKHSKQDAFVKNTKATDNDRFQNGQGPRTYILISVKKTSRNAHVYYMGNPELKSFRI